MTRREQRLFGVAVVGVMLLAHQLLRDQSGAVGHVEGVMGAIMIGAGLGFLVRL